MLLHRHFHTFHHHSKHHLNLFHIKHGVSTFAIWLLIILAIQINLFYYLGIMPIQTMETDIPMSFAGSVLPIVNMVKEIIISFF